MPRWGTSFTTCPGSDTVLWHALVARHTQWSEHNFTTCPSRQSWCGGWGGVVAVNTGCECIGGTHCSSVLSSADDVLEVSVVHAVRGIGELCEMCMCLARDEAGSEWVWGLGLGFTNPVGISGVKDVCLCHSGVGGAGGEWIHGFDQGLERWGGVMSVWVWIICVDGRSIYLYIVIGGYMHILGAPKVQSCCTLFISGSYCVFVCGRYCISRLVCVWLSGQNLSWHHPLQVHCIQLNIVVNSLPWPLLVFPLVVR